MSQKLKAVQRQSRSPKRRLPFLEPQCSCVDGGETKREISSPSVDIDPRKITDRPSIDQENVTDRPSPRRGGSIEDNEKTARPKGSLKLPRGENEPPFTLRIPITEGNGLRKSITWSRSSRCYLYASDNHGNSLRGRCLAHKTCPFLLVCCVLPTILVTILCFFLIPFGKDDNIGDDKFDYYKKV
ncbi:unnamed protein product, partial [Mesorhabditis belari]|uniref:Uncharacterized protein n=1 Tax=Mesorhabditis belari TaxID=2138241 RepID=A0AAF3E923_9BILA